MWPDGCHYYVFEAAGMDVAPPHVGTRWTCDRLAPGTSKRKRRWTVNWRFGKSGPAAATSGKSFSCALCWNLRYWRTNELSEASAIKAALGVIQSGWWTQEVANKAGIAEHPFCLSCGPAVLGSAQHRLFACPAYRETRMDFLRLISIRDRLRLVTNSSGREA